ncbi:MAG TPA: 2TM domain-containing protein [Mycobacteriales bacterium]|nr:2TM domain-containing protein [Mycobacteriales bacterium]
MHDDVAGLDEDALRKKAVWRLRKQRGFRTHLITYVLINAFLTLIWAIGGTDDFYWPLFVEGFWGIFVLLNAWTAYRPESFSEADIQKQMDRMRPAS